MNESVEPFYEEDSDPTVFVKDGCTLIKSICNCYMPEITLDDLRYNQFIVLSVKKL